MNPLSLSMAKPEGFKYNQKTKHITYPFKFEEQYRIYKFV